MRLGMLWLLWALPWAAAQEVSPAALQDWGNYLKKVNPASYLLYAAEAKDYVELFEPFILDIRTADERAKGYIPGSVHIHISQLPDKLAQLPQDKSKPLLVYCNTGHVSAVASSYLRALGYTEVKNLNGGFRSWLELKLPIDKP